MIPRFPGGFSHPMRIGEGAFASVYRVRQEALGRWVALKFMYEKKRAKRHELLREARTQAKMRAGCVPQMYDAFEWRNSVCMVMEFIRGLPLSVLLGAPLSTADRLSLAGSFIRALATIHSQGFAHRDLKPENVIVTPDRGLFLVDFGFTKDVTEIQSSTLNAKGTPAYMAPELWSSGSEVDLRRADVYAAGKVLTQILASVCPEAFLKPLLCENPLGRPASGIELLESWEKEPEPEPRPDWTRMASDMTSERMSVLLLGAARQLLYARRIDEAYWLLVESIEENGNNREAVVLLGDFQNGSTGGRPKLVQYVPFAVILAGCVCIAFVAGMRKSANPELFPPVHHRRASVLLSPSASGPVFSGAAALRVDSLRHDKLTGRLLVRGVPEGVSLSVDGKPAPDTARVHGLTLHWGEHELTLRDGAGRTLRYMNVNVLPFQTRTVDFPVKPGEERDR